MFFIKIYTWQAQPTGWFENQPTNICAEISVPWFYDMDKYDVLGLIGEGSFGRVFRARSKINDDIVAFKVIRKVC